MNAVLGGLLILSLGFFLGYLFFRLQARGKEKTVRKRHRPDQAGGADTRDGGKAVPSGIDQSQDRGDLMVGIVKHAVDLTQSAGGAVLVQDPPGGEWRITAMGGENISSLELPGGSWDTICSRAKASSGPIQVNLEPAAPDSRRCRLLGATITWEDEDFGILILWQERGSDQDIPGEDLEALDHFRREAARMLTIQKLRTQTEQQHALVASLQEVCSLLVDPRPLDEFLDTLLASLENVVPYASASILLMDEAKEVYLAASRGIEDEERARQAIAESGEDLILINLTGKRSIYLPDVRDDPGWIRIPGTEYIRSWIGVGLFVQGEYIGTLNIDHDQVDAYDRYDIQTAQAFADQAAAAIENSRLLHNTRISKERLQVLYELNNKMAETLDPDEIILRALHLAQSALGGEKADYYQYNFRGDQVRLYRSVGRDDRGAEVINRFLAEDEDKSELGWVQDHRKGIRISNVHEHDLWIKFPEVDTDIRSLITVPVFIDRELSGAISVLHTREAAFSAQHEEILLAIARQIGLALNNARRYHEVKRLLELLEAHQQLQDYLFEHLPVGVLLLDDNYRILSANLEGLSIMEHLQPGFDKKTVESLAGRSIQRLLSLAESGRTLELKSGPEKQQVYQVRLRKVKTTASPYWVLMISDVTEDLQKERAVQMQQRLATLGQFAAGITHDFNNIISSILVYADILKRDPELSPGNASRVHVIREQSRRAADLIRQILDFSRRSVLTREPMDLIPFLIHAQELLTRVLSDQYPVRLNLPADRKPLMIRGDQTGLQQTLMNLALNARDAMEDGGEIIITADRTSLDPDQEPPVPGMSGGEWVVLQVVDQGIGIPEEEIPHIFEPFYTTKSSKQGTGLGLAQVYGIVKQHGGFIDVESVPSEGTTFRIFLPADQGADLQPSRPEGTRTLQGREQVVLVVEDEVNLREALWNFLEDCDFQVITASNGARGLDVLQQMGSQISLIISDVVMPEMGGIEFVREAREIYPDLPVLFITGHQENLQNHDLLQDPEIRLLTKPFSLDELVDVVGEFDQGRFG